MITCDILHADSSRINLLEEAFWFGVNELMPRKKNLDVTIRLCNYNDSADGWHMQVDKYEHEIELKKDLDEDDLLTALWHEMVHVRQTESGQLKDNGVLKSWKGEEYINMFSTVDEYMALPWEKEAYILQEELLEKWKKL